ncbi:MAG: hypothetical protein AB8H03_07870 [Saprospiraceae bacterium]
MKISKILAITFFLVLLGAGLYIYNQASNLKYPEFVRLENIKFKNVTLPPDLKITFTSEAVINNPNPHKMTISKVDFDVIVDGEKTTHFTQDLEIEMAANSDFSLPLSFEVPIAQKDFFKNFKNVLNGAWKKQSIKIRSLGTITIRQSRVQFDIPFDYDDEYRLMDYL